MAFKLAKTINNKKLKKNKLMFKSVNEDSYMIESDFRTETKGNNFQLTSHKEFLKSLTVSSRENTDY